METIQLAIPEVILIKPKIHEDERGHFCEIYRENFFTDLIGRKIEFVQENCSLSKCNVIRGLHYQVAPMAQGKLIRVTRGSIFDVAVDIRPGSATYGKWTSAMLSADEREQLWIPEGFAHGFLSLEDDTEVVYKTTQYYAPECEKSILWNDPKIGIQWPIVGEVCISSKDLAAELLEP